MYIIGLESHGNNELLQVCGHAVVPGTGDYAQLDALQPDR